MAYIISVNANIVSQSGGTCVCPPGTPDLCDNDPAYMQCVQDINRDMVTATAAIAALASFCMGVFANVCSFGCVGPVFRTLINLRCQSRSLLEWD